MNNTHDSCSKGAGISEGEILGVNCHGHDVVGNMELL